MSSNTINGERIQERRLLLVVTTLLLLLIGRLYMQLQPELDTTEAALKNGEAVLVNNATTAESLQNLFALYNYFPDPKDQALVVEQLVKNLQQNGSIPNLGELNKLRFDLVVDSTQGGAGWEGRVQASYQRLGWNDKSLLVLEKTGRLNVPSQGIKHVSQRGSMQIEGHVHTVEKPEGILVKLTRHPATTEPEESWQTDTLPASFPDRIIRATDTLTRAVIPVQEEYYLRTDASGYFRFEGLLAGEAYSVVPMQPGREFGSSQGSSNLTKNQQFEFTQKLHRLHLLPTDTYRQMKEGEVLVVRSPSSFRSTFIQCVFLFFLPFLLLHLLWSVRNYTGDPFILPIIMLLTGLSLITLLSLQDPLRDILYASSMAKGMAFALAGFYALSSIDYIKFYHSPMFDFVGYRIKHSIGSLPGYFWLLLALSFPFVLLTPLGFGPEGSGVKVNLNLFLFSFQPSELTKFLFVIFLAAYFTANSPYFRSLENFHWRLQNSLVVILGIGFMLGLYLILGDMGPALVLGFTFLLFYSISRGDLREAILGAILYAVLLKGASLLTGGYQNDGYFEALLTATVVYFGVVILYGLLVKRLQDSALLMGLLIAAFTLGDAIPKVGERLTERKSMWLNPWENESYGGDHIAHSMWSLSTGGVAGQGVGQGYANVMPAAHTDMILPAFGEEMGWLGLLSICLLLALLLHRSLLIARRSGTPFTFYLAAGVALVTSVQFLLIAGGAFGMIPLTGVSVPFISYGVTSLVINIAAFGIVMSISTIRVQSIQKTDLQSRYDATLLAGMGLFGGGMVLLLASLFYFQVVARSQLIVEPALVADRLGKRVYSYNPRITLLARKLPAGTLFDRHGLILATSDPALLSTQLDSLERVLIGSGGGSGSVRSLIRKRQSRYYPFQEHLFYWTGDANSRLFWNGANGYFAEDRHLSELRGFNTHPSRPEDKFATRYREGRFMKEQGRTLMTNLIRYDYTELVPLLQSGVRSTAVENFKARNKDLHLTVDAELQLSLQAAIRQSRFRNRRVSVVVLDAGSGEVLASAINPLPDLNQPEKLSLSDFEKNREKLILGDRDLGSTYATAPGSTAKILTALAALNQVGIDAARTTFQIPASSRIRSDEPTGAVDMNRAIVGSSNIYFIKLANELALDQELSELYQAAGFGIGVHIQLAGENRGHLRFGNYFYQKTPLDSSRQALYRTTWQREVFAHNRNFYQLDERIVPRRPHYPKKYQSEFSQLAWGQGKLVATPLALARVAGAIANKGIMMPSVYLLPGQRLASTPVWAPRRAGIAAKIQDFMLQQSKNTLPGYSVAGKTGTPQRDLNNRRINDGWYVFFSPNQARTSNTVVCIRIELGGSSASATELARTLIPILHQKGYIYKP